MRNSGTAIDKFPPHVQAQIARELTPARNIEQAAREQAGISHRDANSTRRKIPHPKPESDKTQSLDGTATGEATGVRRPCVRFVGYRVRPLDPDNFAASVKDLLDGLRHSGLIPGDEPWKIRLETEQVKVSTFREERTEITLTLGS